MSICNDCDGKGYKCKLKAGDISSFVLEPCLAGVVVLIIIGLYNNSTLEIPVLGSRVIAIIVYIVVLLVILTVSIRRSFKKLKKTCFKCSGTGGSLDT